jgi:hypothetical protein
MHMLAREPIKEARTVLESVARHGEPPAAGVQQFIRPAGWAHYRELCAHLSETAAITTDQNQDKVRKQQRGPAEYLTGQGEPKTGLVKGMRVKIPSGQAMTRSVRYCDQLKRFRCSVETDAVQPDGSS